MAPPRARSLRAVARRLTILTLGTLMAATATLVANPNPALAATCPTGVDWTLYHWSSNGTRYYRAYIFEEVSSVPTFNVSDSRVAVNGLNNPISVTFTSAQSRTFTLSVTASMQAKLANWLTATVSSTITTSRTTQIGVSVTATVPAHSTIQGDYGIQAFIVTYRVTTITRIVYPSWPHMPSCGYSGPDTQTVNAPTIVEGWQIRQL